MLVEISSRMAARIREHERAIRNEPRTRQYYEHKGARDALQEFVDEISRLEDRLSNEVNRRLRDERNSGYGRGDSMG